jgi:histidinol-phosphatase (PHP family)
MRHGHAALPADRHVHSQWSWDALAGSMEGTCALAAEIGLSALAFTEHADFTAWALPPGEKVPDRWRPLVRDDVLTPPPLDLHGYRDFLRRCRERFPGLRILSGVELSERHWHPLLAPARRAPRPARLPGRVSARAAEPGRCGQGARGQHPGAAARRDPRPAAGLVAVS